MHLDLYLLVYTYITSCRCTCRRNCIWADADVDVNVVVCVDVLIDAPVCACMLPCINVCMWVYKLNERHRSLAWCLVVLMSFSLFPRSFEDLARRDGGVVWKKYMLRIL
jgi:hypothetical protein